MTTDLLYAVRSYLKMMPASEREEIMSELHAHLEDKAAALRAQGQSPADAEANARASFGDPTAIGTLLAAVHSRPTRRQTILAILPFLMSAVLLPILILAIVALDRTLGPMPEKFMRLMGLRLYHVETTILFCLVVLAMCGLFALGALIGLWRHLPLWSVTWVGSTLTGLVLFVQLLLDESPQATVILVNVLVLALLMAGLIAVARWRGGVVALLIAAADMLQSGIFSAYALSTPPLDLSALAVVLAAAVGIVAAFAFAGVLHMQPGRWLVVALAVLFSIVPYSLELALQVDAATTIMRLLANIALPIILLFLIPYLVGRHIQAPARR